jgi:hypothetical protein
VHDLVRAFGSKLVWNQGYILEYLQNTKTSCDHTGLGKSLLANEKTEVFLSEYQATKKGKDACYTHILVWSSNCKNMQPRVTYDLTTSSHAGAKNILSLCFSLRKAQLSIVFIVNNEDKEQIKHF